jgi:hypothetical protein
MCYSIDCSICLDTGHISHCAVKFSYMISIQKIKKNKKIIVEDEEDILILYKDFLSRKGHEVATTFLNGEDIIKEINNEHMRYI